MAWPAPGARAPSPPAHPGQGLTLAGDSPWSRDSPWPGAHPGRGLTLAQGQVKKQKLTELFIIYLI